MSYDELERRLLGGRTFGPYERAETTRRTGGDKPRTGGAKGAQSAKNGKAGSGRSSRGGTRS